MEIGRSHFEKNRANFWYYTFSAIARTAKLTKRLQMSCRMFRLRSFCNKLRKMYFFTQLCLLIFAYWWNFSRTLLSKLSAIFDLKNFYIALSEPFSESFGSKFVQKSKNVNPFFLETEIFLNFLLQLLKSELKKRYYETSLDSISWTKFINGSWLARTENNQTQNSFCFRNYSVVGIITLLGLSRKIKLSSF